MLHSADLRCSNASMNGVHGKPKLLHDSHDTAQLICPIPSLTALGFVPLSLPRNHQDDLKFAPQSLVQVWNEEIESTITHALQAGFPWATRIFPGSRSRSKRSDQDDHRRKTISVLTNLATGILYALLGLPLRPTNDGLFENVEAQSDTDDFDLGLPGSQPHFQEVRQTVVLMTPPHSALKWFRYVSEVPPPPGFPAIKEHAKIAVCVRDGSTRLYHKVRFSKDVFAGWTMSRVFCRLTLRSIVCRPNVPAAVDNDFSRLCTVQTTERPPVHPR